MMAVKIGSEDVMAVSIYPREGNPLWEEYSTITVVEALKSFSKYTFDYPYHKAVSVHAHQIGMEYPMICFNCKTMSEYASDIDSQSGKAIEGIEYFKTKKISQKEKSEALNYAKSLNNKILIDKIKKL